MTARTLLALLLTLSLLPSAAHGSAGQGRVAEDLTPEEGREARDLARQFVERLREHNDVAPLVKDLFVRDFGTRLRHERVQLPLAFVTPEVAAHASEEELLCFYIAEFNFFSRTLAYLLAHPPNEDEDEDEECNDLCEVEKMYPPAVVRVLKDDPIFSAMMEKEAGNHAAAKEGGQTTSADVADAGSNPQPEEEDDPTFVKDLVMLRATTATTGKAAEVLRAYAPEFSALRRTQEAGTPRETLEEVHEPSLETYEKNYFGFPPGTRFVCVHVEPAYDIEFDLTLVAEDGRLRILFAVPLIGD